MFQSTKLPKGAVTWRDICGNQTFSFDGRVFGVGKRGLLREENSHDGYYYAVKRGTVRDPVYKAQLLSLAKEKMQEWGSSCGKYAPYITGDRPTSKRAVEEKEEAAQHPEKFLYVLKRDDTTSDWKIHALERSMNKVTLGKEQPKEKFFLPTSQIRAHSPLPMSFKPESKTKPKPKPKPKPKAKTQHKAQPKPKSKPRFDSELQEAVTKVNKALGVQGWDQKSIETWNSEYGLRFQRVHGYQIQQEFGKHVIPLLLQRKDILFRSTSFSIPALRTTPALRKQVRTNIQHALGENMYYWLPYQLDDKKELVGMMLDHASLL